MNDRIIDLLNFAAEEGLTLPLPAAQIAALEERGHVVDLATGEIRTHAADGEHYGATMKGHVLYGLMERDAAPCENNS